MQKIHEILVEVSAEIDKINSDVIKFYTCLIQSNLIEMIKLLSLIHFDFAKRMQFSCLTEKENGKLSERNVEKFSCPLGVMTSTHKPSHQLVVFAAQLIKVLASLFLLASHHTALGEIKLAGI